MNPGVSAPQTFGLSRDRVWHSSLWVGTILVLALVGVRHFTSNLHWLVQASQGLFSTDFYILNGTHYSPLAVLFYWPLTWLGLPTSVTAERWILLVLALGILPLAMFSTRVLNRGNPSLDESRTQALLLFFVVFACVGATFGTPCHLFLAFFLPYLLIGMGRIDGNSFPVTWARISEILAGSQVPLDCRGRVSMASRVRHLEARGSRTFRPLYLFGSRDSDRSALATQLLHVRLSRPHQSVAIPGDHSPCSAVLAVRPTPLIRQGVVNSCC